MVNVLIKFYHLGTLIFKRGVMDNDFYLFAGELVMVWVFFVVLFFLVSLIFRPNPVVVKSFLFIENDMSQVPVVYLDNKSQQWRQWSRDPANRFRKMFSTKSEQLASTKVNFNLEPSDLPNKINNFKNVLEFPNITFHAIINRNKFFFIEDLAKNYSSCHVTKLSGRGN